MKCRAALVPRMGDEIVIEEVELAEPGDYDVRIKVMTCSVCHSDIHGLNGEHGEYDGPGLAGHEIAGVVDKVGAKVTYVKPGDRVLSSLRRHGCGQCVQCLNGREWHCDNIPPVPFRLPSAVTRSNGEKCTLTWASGFAEYTNAHESTLCKLDDDIPFEIASAISCGFISGFGAVLTRCKVQPGESIVIVGCGGVGLSAVMGARYCGAIPLIAVDIADVKLKAALEFGATHAINPKECDAVAEVLKITGGYGADHSVVATAGSGLKRSTINMTAKYGHCVVIGHGRYEDEMLGDISAMDFLLGRRLTGSVMGGDIRLRRDISKYMDMYRKGLVPIDKMLTKRYPFENIKEALDDALTGSLKNVVVIGGLE